MFVPQRRGGKLKDSLTALTGTKTQFLFEIKMDSFGSEWIRWWSGACQHCAVFIYNSEGFSDCLSLYSLHTGQKGVCTGAVRFPSPGGFLDHWGISCLLYFAFAQLMRRGASIFLENWSCKGQKHKVMEIIHVIRKRLKVKTQVF